MRNSVKRIKGWLDKVKGKRPVIVAQADEKLLEEIKKWCEMLGCVACVKE